MEKKVGKVAQLKDFVVEIAAGSETNHSIYDVVLPLVGHETRLPANECGKIIEELLRLDGLSKETFVAH